MPELGIPRENIVFVSGIGCAVALPVLHADLRDALDPRPRAGDRDRARDDASGPLGVGRLGRRRRALDRRQPPDPRAAPQRQPHDPALQQPHLRAHQGAVLADLGARQGHEVDPATGRSTGRSARSRSRSAPRRPSSRARSTPTSRGWPRCSARPPRTAARRSSRSSRTATSTTTGPGTSSATTRRTGSTSGRARRSAGATRASGCAPTARSRSSPRTRAVCSSTTRAATIPGLSFALARLTWKTAGCVPLGIFRNVERPVYDDDVRAQLAEARERKGEGDLATLVAGNDTWVIE